MNTDLMSATSRVETPFIIVTIAGYTFGGFNKNVKNVIDQEGTYNKIVTQYPNFMQSLNIVKVNGTLNTYTLVMKYQITQNDDPNLLEKVFSKAKSNREIILTYGDWSIPSYIYKEEKAIITTIKSNIDIASSSITYTLNCISKALSLTAGTFSFPKVNDKPSNIIKNLLEDENQYHLKEIFYGMTDSTLLNVQNLIASNDKKVQIEAKSSITLMNYINYLVSCMVDVNDLDDTLIKSSRYVFTVHDDIKNEFGGPYFKVTQVKATVTQNMSDIFEINIGYPGIANVMSFNINNDETYSILYDYSNEVAQSDYIYRIDNNGKSISEYSPTLSNSALLMKTTESDKVWWTQMTQYPITATLTIKGLLKPTLLMTYLKINTLFYGRNHISSGLYIITKQTDSVDSSGYKTVLNLTRISTLEDN